MTTGLKWAVDQHGEITTARLIGSVDEDADLDSLYAQLKTSKNLNLDLSEVERINSCGVRAWVNFMRSLEAIATVSLKNCSPVIVNQANMISNFVGAARILSVQAPYLCESCDHTENVLLDVASGSQPVLDDKKCPNCGEMMIFDDVEDTYFSFLS